MFPGLMQNFGYHNVKDQCEVTAWLKQNNLYHNMTNASTVVRISK
jgi:hypothetical protein